MTPERLRQLWREAQARRRARLAITGKRKAHKPRADHPWVAEKAVQAKRAKRERDDFAVESYADEPTRLTPEDLRAEMGW